MRPALIALTAVLLVIPSAYAQEGEDDGFHRFHAAALIGETHSGAMDGVTFGGDLEVRFVRPLGIGITGEHVSEPFRENVWVFPLIVHPTHSLKLTIGPGFERARHDERHPVEQHGLLRVGASYDFPLRHGWTIDPDVAIDFVAGEHVLIYAVAIGKEFGHTSR